LLPEIFELLCFLGIGAQKTGTTWLVSLLKQLTELRFPERSVQHFWDSPAHFDLASYQALFAGSELQGEMRPAYGMLPVETIRIIHHHFPDIRLIFMMRNPMERAWSSAKMALARSEMSLEEASDQWFIDHFNSAGSLARGDYQTCIENWRSVFPASSLALFRYEQIINEPRDLLLAACRHIGLDTAKAAIVDEAFLRIPVFQSMSGNLRDSLKPELTRLYSGKINRLSNYLSDDFSDWRV
jgi:hypothetical protein